MNGQTGGLRPPCGRPATGSLRAPCGRPAQGGRFATPRGARLGVVLALSRGVAGFRPLSPVEGSRGRRRPLPAIKPATHMALPPPVRRGGSFPCLRSFRARPRSACAVRVFRSGSGPFRKGVRFTAPLAQGARRAPVGFPSQAARRAAVGRPFVRSSVRIMEFLSSHGAVIAYWCSAVC